jgi:TRAP-type C4-dicarboxylate transport system permease small subunit
MGALIKVCTRALEALSATILLVLTLMVFLNVVLRYCFNSGITVTEELGRFLLVWLVFAGAILAAGSDAHVRVDLFVRKFPRLPRFWIEVICDIIMIYCCWLIVQGGWKQTVLNVHNYLSVSGVPESWMYGSGLIGGVLVGAILVVRLAARVSSFRHPVAGER